MHIYITQTIKQTKNNTQPFSTTKIVYIICNMYFKIMHINCMYGMYYVCTICTMYLYCIQIK